MRRAAWLALAALIGAACSVGQGSGWVRGAVRDRLCMFESDGFDLRPTFFSADFVEDVSDPDGARRRVTIRVQRGSYREGDSDGVSMLVSDVNVIERDLRGLEVPVGPDQLVQMTLYLGQTCISGPPNGYRDVPSYLRAVQGNVVFEEVFAPDLGDEDSRFHLRWTDVVFEDPYDPEGRHATLSGEVDFTFQRGRPAQTFP